MTRLNAADMFDIKTDVGNFSFMAKHPSTKLEFISAYNKVSLYEGILITKSGIPVRLIN